MAEDVTRSDLLQASIENYRTALANRGHLLATAGDHYVVVNVKSLEAREGTTLDDVATFIEEELSPEA